MNPKSTVTLLMLTACGIDEPGGYGGGDGAGMTAAPQGQVAGQSAGHLFT